MGKSGAVARKIAGTLASTGTPALFLHPGEALHGDLGMVTGSDIVLALSYSGETDELLAVLPALKRRARALLAMTGSARSTLAQAGDVVLDVCVPREACPHNLAPTTSTTAMMALGDALAVAVMEARDFRRDDYARLHPAGSLGRRLLLHAHDVMRRGDELAVVPETATVHEALFAVTRAGAGAACIVDEHGRLTGILTDGDVRRAWLQNPDALAHAAREVMTASPRVVVGNPLAYEVVQSFETGAAKIGDLPIVDEDGRPVGMLMLKDLLRAGILTPDAPPAATL
jgi:arabinose-5-phosphate isomerase